MIAIAETVEMKKQQAAQKDLRKKKIQKIIKNLLETMKESKMNFLGFYIRHCN